MATEKGAGDGGLCPQGNLTVMEKLARVVAKNGDILTNCPAKQIVVTKGAATGVVVEKDGKEIEIPRKHINMTKRPHRRGCKIKLLQL